MSAPQHHCPACGHATIGATTPHGKAILARLAELPMTRVQFSQATGFHYNSLRNILTRRVKHQLQWATTERICAALRLTREEFAARVTAVSE